MPDSNDIPFNQYSVDLSTFFNFLFKKLFGGAGGIGGGSDTGVLVGGSLDSFIHWLSSAWSILIVLGWLLSFLFLYGLVFAYIRGNQLGEVVAAILAEQEQAYKQLSGNDVKNKRWADVLSHLQSERMNDWKLAIIEADILLEELLDNIGYAGNTIGDKLKSASPDNFQTINQAWRAHNVRNRIAHEGANFDLTQKAAQETITQFKMVFDEFDFV